MRKIYGPFIEFGINQENQELYKNQNILLAKKVKDSSNWDARQDWIKIVWLRRYLKKEERYGGQELRWLKDVEKI